MLGKVTFDERVNVLERYCEGDLSITFTNLNGSLSKIKGPKRSSFAQCIKRAYLCHLLAIQM